MRIACPACSATYQVPDDQLREGRVVRCARCATDWAPIVAAPAPDPEPEPEPKVTPEIQPEPLPVPEPEPEPEPTPSALPRRMAIEDAEVAVEPATPVPPVVPPAAVKPRRGPSLLAVAWVLSLLVVGGALAALVTQRDRVMAAWPPSQRAYAALGLAPRS